MTNYEHYLQEYMSVEKLARQLIKWELTESNNIVYYGPDDKTYADMDICLKHIEEWLKQPYFESYN